MCRLLTSGEPRSDPDKIDINVRCLDGFDLAAIIPPALGMGRARRLWP
jgi:hypothetical protein